VEVCVSRGTARAYQLHERCNGTFTVARCMLYRDVAVSSISAHTEQKGIGHRKAPTHMSTLITSIASRSETRRPLGTEHADYGWRFHGRHVGVLPDRSYRLVPADQQVDGILAPYRANLTTLQACLQCGTCTANCDLVGPHSHFPRRQMNLFQIGQHERLLADRTVWYCYNCDDCSQRCPSGAKPGKLMGAVRQMAVEHFAYPSFMVCIANRSYRWWVLFAVAALLLLGVIAVGGTFFPAANQVHYASMLPHLTVNIFFVSVTGLVVAGLAVGAARAWSTFHGEPLRRARPRVFLRAVSRVVVDILAHRRFSECGEHRLRGYAHLAVFYGFLGLAALAGVAALLIVAGSRYPFPAMHPLKITGNVAAVLLLWGTAYFAYERYRATLRGDRSTYFDWLLLVNLLLVGITGVLCEVLRYVNVASVAYPMYFLHLVFVFVLLVTLPYSKLAHLCYRVLALTSEQYNALA
jgi:quinone-modifying oxidoreductase, subunit QmoC